MIKIDKPIIVEGKYDKITLENVVDALIISTDGFGIFKNKDKCRMIKMLAQQNDGIIVMTDSDNAGSQIRAYLKNIVGESPIINVYVPSIKGKEKRKSAYSKQGLLGVEGMTPAVIIDALKKSGINAENVANKKSEITKTDMFELGLSGCSDSALNRKRLLEFLGLPENLSPNAMLDVLNNMFSLEEFFEVNEKCRNTQDKN